MKKAIFAIILFLGTAHIAFGQDTLYLINGEKIEALVSDVDINVIKYKKYDNQQGPTYILPKQQIISIIYHNGTKDEFNLAKEKTFPPEVVGESINKETPSKTGEPAGSAGEAAAKTEPLPEEPLFEINAGASYSSVDLADVKGDFTDAAKSEMSYFLSTVGGQVSWQVTQGNASSGFVDGYYKIAPYLSAGIKLSYLWVDEMKSEVTGNGDNGETFAYKATLAPSLFSVLAGLKVQTPRYPHGISWTGSALAGPAFANATLKVKASFADPANHSNNAMEYSIPMSGNGFYADLGGAMEPWLSESFGLTLGVRYHYCVINQMQSTGNVDLNHDGVREVHTGDYYNHINGGNVVFNFSGWDITGGIKYYF